MAIKRSPTGKKTRVGAAEGSLLADVPSDPNEARIDPYLQWAIATDFAYIGEHAEWFPVLLELRGGWAAQFATMINSLDDPNKTRVASIYQTAPREYVEQDLTFCTALVTRKALLDILGNPAKALPSVKRFELCSPVVPSFPPSPLKKLAPLVSTPPKAAIVAVIDDGLAFANERFRNATGGTRFKYFWNQDDTTGINPAPGFGWGRELTQAQIDGLLAACTHSGIVDEEALYLLAGQKLAARRAKHGTHVMDLACGMAPQTVSATSPYLIGVQLPRWVTTETSGGMLTGPVLDALHYILNRADQIAAQENTAPLPIVVNLSYGTIAGPHDGTAMLEAAIDQLIASRPIPLRVVLPAGNHLLARCHARFRMSAVASPGAHFERLQWRVQPDDQSASFMEIWLPHSAATQVLPHVEVRVTTPDGAQSPWIGPGGFWKWSTATYTWFYMKYFNSFPAGSRPMILLGIAPTAQVATAPRIAPCGTWRVEVRNKGRAVTIDAWVQRGDTPFGYPLKGRQSRFDDPRYVLFDLAGRPEEDDIGPSHVHRRGSINALATGRNTLVIGGFRRSDFRASKYSSSGPVITPPATAVWRDGPDATAVGDESPPLRGLIAAGTRTGSVFAMNGTSVAAPQVTRLIAQRMTLGLLTTRAAMRAFAKLNDPAPHLPSDRGGEGRIPMPPRVRRRP